MADFLIKEKTGYDLTIDMRMCISGHRDGLRLGLPAHKGDWYGNVRSANPMACAGPLILSTPSGLHLVPFICDRKDAFNQCASVIYRSGCQMPCGNDAALSDFLEYSKRLIEVVFTPVEKGTIKDPLEWLAQSSYSGARKKNLEQAFKRQRWFLSRENAFDCKSFIKDECYPIDWSFTDGSSATVKELGAKWPRCIMSFDDDLKAVVGPLFHAIDKATFKSKYFVKGVAPREWPKMMLDLFGTASVVETDFSSFEAHHEGLRVEVVRHWVMHMLRSSDVSRSTLKMVSKMMLGMHHIKMKNMTATFPQRLMSGASWTSSANGVLNLCIMSYLCQKSKHPDHNISQLVDSMVTEFKGFVEGDDGICQTDGIDEKLIESLGLRLKFDPHAHFWQSGFCGVVCSPDTMNIMTDPMKAILSLPILPIKYEQATDQKRKALLRAKALSLLYNYGSCPILSVLCHKILDLTRGMDVSKVIADVDTFKQNYVLLANKERVWQRRQVIDIADRLVVEAKYNMPVHIQLMLEESIDRSAGWNVVIPVDGFLPQSLIDYFSRFAVSPNRSNEYFLPCPGHRPKHLEPLISDWAIVRRDTLASAARDPTLHGKLALAKHKCLVADHYEAEYGEDPHNYVPTTW